MPGGGSNSAQEATGRSQPLTRVSIIAAKSREAKDAMNRDMRA